MKMDIKIALIAKKMIEFYKGEIHDIDHFLRVWSYARIIGEMEKIDSKTLYILEIAAITHDIACPLCREKYGSTNGKYQEKEGVILVEGFLEEFDIQKDVLERIKYLVGHHHTLSEIDGIDYQILIEADYIANATENGYDEKNVESFLRCVAKTSAGRGLIEGVC